MQLLSDLVVFNKYARYDPEKQRRETFEEIVTRNKQMHIKKFPELESKIETAYKAVYAKKVLPSMRSMQFAGDAIEQNNARMYNCAYLPMSDTTAFAETMYLLLGGTGVGYSVQDRHISQLPTKFKQSRKSVEIKVEDSIEGWADAVKTLINSFLYDGEQPLRPKFNFSKIREKGVLLKTSGGKSPGAEPLKVCLDKITEILRQIPEGCKLRSIDVHDIVCAIAHSVLSGGIRRSACISFFDKDDTEMLTCKSEKLYNILVDYENKLITYTPQKKGKFFYVADNKYKNYKNRGFSYPLSMVEDENFKSLYLSTAFYENLVSDDYNITPPLVKRTKTTKVYFPCIMQWFTVNPNRGRANNSVVLKRDSITKGEFIKLIKKTYESYSGEPGIFWTNNYDICSNPCAEISLEAYQFCNLVTIDYSKINIFNKYDISEITHLCDSAAFIATLQASYTDFKYLRKEWKEVTERGALIGVSMTGLASIKKHKVDLSALAEIIKETNESTAKSIGINPADRCTTVKPEGTSSLVLGTSSGVHAYYDKYYLRRMQLDKSDEMYKYLKEVIPNNLEDYWENPDKTAVLIIPVESPKGAVLRLDETVIEFLERVKKLNVTWIKNGHRKGDNYNNVSCTANVPLDWLSWQKVGNWLWKNKDSYTAISLLPLDNGTYKQPPFEGCDYETYLKYQINTEIDLTLVKEFTDTTDLEGEIACSGGVCEII